MRSWHFTVSGSEGNQYEVVAERVGERLTMSCTCGSAAAGRKCCKHQVALLAGVTDGILSNNVGQVGELHALIRGSKIEELVADYQAAVHACEQADQLKKKATRAREAARQALTQELHELH
jgi:uncharacterized Zn finger protein